MSFALELSCSSSSVVAETCTFGLAVVRRAVAPFAGCGAGVLFFAATRRGAVLRADCPLACRATIGVPASAETVGPLVLQLLCAAVFDVAAT